MARLIQEQKAKFGTFPVFMTAISTILGAILFLRFGYAVANVGFIGVIGIIIIGHLVTFPTAMAVAEIATNQGVELFDGYKDLGNILFVSANEEKDIS